METYKLFKNICTNIFNHRKLPTTQSTWLTLLENEEKEYFKKKTDLYLHYVANELSKGRSIDDLITEVQLQQQQYSDHLSSMHDRIKEEDLYITRNKEFINYVANEFKNGKALEEIIAESKKILQTNRNKADSKLY